MKITKANGKAEYAVMENLKKRIDETDEKIVAIVSNMRLRKTVMTLFVNSLFVLTAVCLKRLLSKKTNFRNTSIW